MTMATMKLNNELNGVELYFNSKPEQNILSTLKGNGFRYSPKKICWYAKQNEKTLKVANEMTNNTDAITTPTTQQATKTKKQVKNVSLFDRVQFIEGNSDTSKYHYNFVGSNYTGLSTKDTAKEIRKHLKSQFPEVKFSVTSDYSSIDITIKESPYSENGQELKSIINYCNQLASSYNFDDSDTMSDYFHNHFYKRICIDYDYIQVEQTEQVKKDIENFNNKLIEEEKKEEERKLKEYEEWKKEQDLKDIEHKKQREEEKKQKEIINNSVKVSTLEEKEQYFVLGSQFAKLNKQNTLDRYKEEVKKGDYNNQNVKITKELHFNSKESLNYFSNMLLHDFDFLTETGGTYTDDERVNTMTDYYNMTKEEQNTVKWNLYGVAVYFNNELQFIVDAQGYSYARYVGLVNNVEVTKIIDTPITVEPEQIAELKHQVNVLEDISFNIIVNNNLVSTWNNDNWKQYKELFKDQLKQSNIKLNKSIIQQIDEESEEFKIAMYKLLIEVDGIQEQFNSANIEAGQKLTICKIGSMGSINISHVTVEEVQPTQYAQYEDAIKMTFKQPKKRGSYQTYLYKDVLIYEGWQEIPNSLFVDTEYKKGLTITRTKFLSCDTKQYDVILDHLNNKNIKPIINTYKPQF